MYKSRGSGNLSFSAFLHKLVKLKTWKTVQPKEIEETLMFMKRNGHL